VEQNQLKALAEGRASSGSTHVSACVVSRICSSLRCLSSFSCRKEGHDGGLVKHTRALLTAGALAELRASHSSLQARCRAVERSATRAVAAGHAISSPQPPPRPVEPSDRDHNPRACQLIIFISVLRAAV
jgi:hypothetical protein